MTTPTPAQDAQPAPCPFCGADGRSTEMNVTASMMPGKMRHAWYCTVCNGEGPTKYSPEEAVAAWNDRASPPTPAGVVQALEMATRFHETYERLAPQFGYETRPETRQFDPESANGKLMIAVCAALASLPQPAVVEVSLPELPDEIGEIVGKRLDPPKSDEFFGYFRDGFDSTKKMRVYTADQLHARDASILAAFSKELGVEVKGKANG